MIYIRREFFFRVGDCDLVIEREEIRYILDYLYIGRGEGLVWFSS